MDIECRQWRCAAFWLVPHELLNPLSYSSRAIPGGSAHSELGPPTSIINQRTALPISHSSGRFFYIVVLYTEMTLAYVKLKKKKQ